MGKLIEEDSFVPPIVWIKPPCTDAANVEDNIVNWIKREDAKALKNFCRPDDTRINKYRFVTADEHTEMQRREKVISGVKVDFKFTRRYHTPDRLWPLWFSHRDTTIVYTIEGIVSEYTTDAQLKRDIQNSKP